MPLFGAILAALFFRLNVWMDNKALEEPLNPVIAPQPVNLVPA